MKATGSELQNKRSNAALTGILSERLSLPSVVIGWLTVWWFSGALSDQLSKVICGFIYMLRAKWLKFWDLLGNN